MDHSQSGPIIACATGENNSSAISIIRISGFDILTQFQNYFATNLSFLKPRHVYHTKLLHPLEGKLIDDVVLTYYQGPKSYNAENILEISCHGNPFIIKNILQLFIVNSNVRKAEPGEFTLRALENKKLTLSQVEGLDLILNSQSNFCINEGLKSLCGELHDAYLQLEKLIVRLCSSIELGIDFIDDVGEESFESEKDRSIRDLQDFLERLHERASCEYSTLLSPEIVLFGPVNAGKSSLFNSLLNNQRSIVSNQAGTTRDFITEYINLEGHHFKLVDTAGLRDTKEVIESEGIERTKSLRDLCFYSVLVIDPTDPNFKKDFQQAKDFDLCILSHSDRFDFSESLLKYSALFSNKKFLKANLTDIGPIEPFSGIGPIEPFSGMAPIEPLPFGVGRLKADVWSKYSKLQEKSPIILPRHREQINSIYLRFKRFQSLIECETDMAIISNELNLLSIEIQTLTGVFTQSQVLNNVFENFCIGK
ncbi:MAG: GTP-binding protein [Bacteriovoracaceae bacterium]|mgnify:CR=1 FL=1|jgi:tRNA modification GTPase|nr:GTP-binding protein [Bacteriovoracaceae bacterium]